MDHSLESGYPRIGTAYSQHEHYKRSGPPQAPLLIGPPYFSRAEGHENTSLSIPMQQRRQNRVNGSDDDESDYQLFSDDDAPLSAPGRNSNNGISHHGDSGYESDQLFSDDSDNETEAQNASHTRTVLTPNRGYESPLLSLNSIRSQSSKFPELVLHPSDHQSRHHPNDPRFRAAPASPAPIIPTVAAAAPVPVSQPTSAEIATFSHSPRDSPTIKSKRSNTTTQLPSSTSRPPVASKRTSLITNMLRPSLSLPHSSAWSTEPPNATPSPSANGLISILEQENMTLPSSSATNEPTLQRRSPNHISNNNTSPLIRIDNATKVDEKLNGIDNKEPQSIQSSTHGNANDSIFVSEKDFMEPSQLCLPTSLAPDVVHIEEIEWATDNLSESSERAVRPKFDKNDDPCGCTPDGTGSRCCVDRSCVLFACQEECRSNCEAGELCGNQRITRRLWKQLEVFDAGVKGRGLRVMEPAKKYDFICEYTGVAIRKKHLDNLFRLYRNERMLYIMALDNDVYIDARKRGGIARYINHSCDPNCAVHRWKVRGVSRAGIFALKDIEVGEELSFDYKWDRKRGRAPTKCHCLSKTCRGTLEMPQESTLEDEELEIKLMGHWKVPKSSKAGREIINRCIKVYFAGNHEYFAADVCKYDEGSGMHCLMYKQDLEESWEDLSKEQWMILDEEAEQFVISKKSNLNRQSLSVSSPAESPGPQQLRVKNYLILQTPMKEELISRHIIDRCQRHFRVQISVIRCINSYSNILSPSVSFDDEEAMEESQALQVSEDGNAWKFTILGMDPVKARQYIMNNINSIEEELAAETNNFDDKDELEEKAGASSKQEIVIPRCVSDNIKSRMSLLRCQCRNVEVTFTHSDSKSKQFAKLVIEGAQLHEVQRAQIVLWKEVLTLCHLLKAPLTPSGLFKDFGFLGGELSCDDFRLLYLNSPKINLSQNCSENIRDSDFFASFEDLHRCTIWVQASEDMGRINSKNRLVNVADSNRSRKMFFGCEPKRIPELWGHIQTRVSELARGVRFLNLESDKLYQPALMRRLERRRRGMEVTFFDYVRKSSGAIVRNDHLTRNHLRVDGGDFDRGNIIDVDGSFDVEFRHRVRLAEEIIKLQLELLRDNRIRQQRWGFGRDWCLLLEDQPKTSLKPDESLGDNASSPVSGRPGSVPTTRSLVDSRNIAAACMDISEITESMGLDASVAAHGCILLYRYLNQTSHDTQVASQSKFREVILACIFLANKAQKTSKWKRLEGLLEAAYKTFYSGAMFDEKNEEAATWEKRVISAENDVLSILEYDVFWPGMDWISIAVVDSEKLSEPLVQNAMQMTLSGPVLAAGPVLWLKLGPEYAFTALAGLLSIDIEPLFAVLSLIPLKVSEAADLIATSIQSHFLTKKTSTLKTSKYARELFNGGQKTLLSNLEHTKGICKARMGYGVFRNGTSLLGLSKQFQIVALRCGRRRIFRGVDVTFLKERIIPNLQKICAESQCNIYFDEGAELGTEDIILEGNWRAHSIAEHLLKLAAYEPPKHMEDDLAGSASVQTGEESNSAEMDSCGDSTPMVISSQPFQHLTASVSSDCPTLTSIDQFPPASDLLASSYELEKAQVKPRPGILSMSDVKTKDAWDGTVECGWKGKLGGKTCVAGKVLESAFHDAGLRWWIPPRYSPSLSGLLCDMFSVRMSFPVDKSAHLDALSDIANSLHTVDSVNEAFPILSTRESTTIFDNVGNGNRAVAVSIQRWPPQKTEMREQSKSGMNVGFSPAALQEMQLLQQLHFLIPAPQGHPNFVLPIAVALAAEEADEKPPEEQSSLSDIMSSKSDDLLSLLQMHSDNGRYAQTKKEEDDACATGSHLVFQPTPIILQRVMGKPRKRDRPEPGLVPPSIFAAWFNDLLSAMAHCHANHIVLRTLHPDQVLIDHCGVAKLSGLSRSIVLHPEDRGKFLDPLKTLKGKGKKGSGNITDDDILSNLYMAPELLLGGFRYTQESDIWALGCLMGNLILNKPIFSGRCRTSKMRAIFKIVGTSASDNYREAAKYPYYEKCKPFSSHPDRPKKYKKDVEKALRYMLKGSNVDADEYAGAFRLIERMLDLDPKKRISAADALNHEYIADYLDKTTSEDFRQIFVKDWINLKNKVMSSLVDEDQDDSENRGTFDERPVKRTSLMAKESTRAYNDDDDDDDTDPYNLDDIMLLEPRIGKKLKVSD